LGLRGWPVPAFFAAPTLNEVTWAFEGGSITNDSIGYRVLTGAWLIDTYPQNTYTLVNSAVDGQNSWSNLVRYPDDIQPHAPDYVVLDAVNDDKVANDPPALEALIRRIWTDTPNCKFIAMKFFGVTDYTDDDTVYTSPDADEWEDIEAILDHYGIPFVDYYSEVVRQIEEESKHLTDFFRDNIHPGDGGRALSAEMLQAAITAGEPKVIGTLAARLHAASEHYEEEPQRLVGTDYDSRTGTWSDDGTVAETSEAGATITYSGTCISFGAIRTDSSDSAIEVSIDGGEYASVYVASNGYQIPAGRGAHTITLKSPGTLEIAEFWMI